METKGFISSLFDLSFASFVTPKIIRVLFVLSLIGIGLWSLLILIAAFNASTGAGVIALIFLPVIFLVGAIFVRVYMETLIVMFKIAENTAATAYNTGSHMASASGGAIPQASPSQRLLELDSLRQAGTISDADYQQKRDDILKSL